jgi:mono/diheme cytochrome c family protein
MKTNVIKVVGVLMIGFVLVSFMQDKKANKKPWDVPAKYLSMKNPNAAGDADAIKLGKMHYAKHCKSCHGNFGKGDGPKARNLETYPGDFTGTEFQSQKDGMIYFQSFVGRDEMPNYEKKIPDDEDRWALVTYLRSLKK